MHSVVIGVDCATRPEKTGLARATFDGQFLRVAALQLAGKSITPVDVVADWLCADKNALIALDSPLGWPRTLTVALNGHMAGKYLPHAATELFSRTTDIEIRRRLKIRPLEVGADRIARTALAALGFLHSLAQKLDTHIDLAWNPASCEGIQAIEVYPRATRQIHEVIAVGESKLSNLPSWVDISEVQGEMASAHTRDAVLCAMAGCDFLTRRAVGPSKDLSETAKQEGWIWA